MEIFNDILQNLWTYIVMATWVDVLDILLMAVIIFAVIRMFSRTNAGRVAKGVLLLLAVFVLSEVIGLNMLSFLLSNTLQIGLIALIVLFQPELRRALAQVGSTGKLVSLFTRTEAEGWEEEAIRQTADACRTLSREKTGALIVFQRTYLLDDVIKTGTVFKAQVQSELLKNIFYPKAPLHDGAAVVRNGVVEAAGCMLPLSGNTDLSKELGMRHRAAIGMSEHSDAVTVVVSEESGSISLCVKGEILRHLTPEKLADRLRRELIPDAGEEDSRVGRALGRIAKQDKKKKSSKRDKGGRP